MAFSDMKLISNLRNGVLQWEIEDKRDGRVLFCVMPKIFRISGRFFRPWCTSEKYGLSIHLIHGDAGAIIEHLTDTDSFDWAVPINADHSYPYGGAAITVYSSNMLKEGIVPLAKVREVVMDSVATMIFDSIGLEAREINDIILGVNAR